MNGVFKIWGLEKKIIVKFGNSYFREPQNLGTRNSTDFKIWEQDFEDNSNYGNENFWLDFYTDRKSTSRLINESFFFAL